MQPKSFYISIPFLLIWFLLYSLQAEAQTANSFFQKGKNLTYKKDYQNALSAFNQALAMDPNHIKALYERGVLRLYYLDQSELALADLQLVYQKEPGFSKIIYYNLANAQSNLGWNEIAIENFNKSLEHLPKFVCAANNRGMCKSELGKYEEALIDFDVALKKDSKEHKKNIFINRANVFANLGQWENAKKDYESSLAIDPFNQHVFINRASWEIKRLEFGSAMNDLSIALNLEEKIKDNSRADHFNQRGFLYFLSGNIQKAIEDDDSMQISKEKDYQILFNYRAFASSILQNQNKDFTCIVWDDLVGNTNNLYQATINRKNKIPKTLGGILYSKEYQANMEPNLLVDGSPVSCKWKKSAIQQQQEFTVIPLQSDFFPLKGKHSYQLQIGSTVSQLVFINQETN
ncbi:MAG: hypothetical protein RLY89_3049 [Bacteroidota bacterium]|jgi:tetratricopeptide (TPR) repeat protein